MKTLQDNIKKQANDLAYKDMNEILKGIRGFKDGRIPMRNGCHGSLMVKLGQSTQLQLVYLIDHLRETIVANLTEHYEHELSQKYAMQLKEM